MRRLEFLSDPEPTSIHDIEVLGRYIVAELPESYREWLRLNGGAYPARNCNFIDRSRISPPPRCSVNIEWFLHARDALDTMVAYGSRIMRGVVPIAEDGDGNFVCIGVSDDNQGKVFFLGS